MRWNVRGAYACKFLDRQIDEYIQYNQLISELVHDASLHKTIGLIQRGEKRLAS
jgi:hypothetical protein